MGDERLPEIAAQGFSCLAPGYRILVEDEAEQKERLREAEAEAEETLEHAAELEREGEELDRTRPREAE